MPPKAKYIRHNNGNVRASVVESSPSPAAPDTEAKNPLLLSIVIRIRFNSVDVDFSTIKGLSMQRLNSCFSMVIRRYRQLQAQERHALSLAQQEKHNITHKTPVQQPTKD